VKRSLDGALGFIRGGLNPEGLWTDFLTLAGESVCWVSGYVGYAACPGGEAPGEDWLGRVASRILARQGPEGGWGYGPGVPPDADSTAWCLLFLSRLGGQSEEARARAVGFLLGHQSRVDGGFRTYAVPSHVGRYMMLDRSVSFDGWASSQNCITGVAVQALLEAGRPGSSVDEALGFVRGSQTAEGCWEPYWWTERLYSTVHCAQALKAGGRPEDAERVSRAEDWIARTQLPDGGWSGLSATDGLPFPTALALSGLLLAPRPRYPQAVEAGIEWLLSRQLADGSWASNHILRIPHPSVKEPWRQARWKRDGRAIDAVIRDQRRLFTTATALSAISRFDGVSSRGGLR